MKNLNVDLSKGIVLFTGYGVENHPGEYPERVSSTFKESNSKTLDETQRVLTDLNQLKPDWSNFSLSEAGKWARTQIQLKHPDLSDDALNALEWTFTWWWK